MATVTLIKKNTHTCTHARARAHTHTPKVYCILSGLDDLRIPLRTDFFFYLRAGQRTWSSDGQLYGPKDTILASTKKGAQIERL
jgi:hypothetical protein